MFVRFRETANRLQLSLVETCRGLGKPLSYDDMVAILGWTDDDIRYSQQLAQFSEDELDALMPEMRKRKERIERAVVRAALRRRAAGADIT
jgi:hypothetical protein